MELNISYSPGDFGGQFFEAITPGPISPLLNAPLSLSGGDFLAGTGGNVVVPVPGVGALYGDYDLERLTISSAAPEPAAWALMMVGFGGLGAAARSRRSARAAMA